eukprot:6854958-Prymnesium_polylepis.1
MSRVGAALIACHIGALALLHLGRGAHRASATTSAAECMYVPPDERAVRRQALQRQATDVRMRQRAVTSEARAIGVQPDESRTLLRRVPARLALRVRSVLRGQAQQLPGR